MTIRTPAEVPAKEKRPSAFVGWLDAHGWTLATLLLVLSLAGKAIDRVPESLWGSLSFATLGLVIHLVSRREARLERLESDYEREQKARDAGGHGALIGTLVGLIVGVAAGAVGYVEMGITFVLFCGVGGGILGHVGGWLTLRQAGFAARLLMLAVTLVAILLLLFVIGGLVGSVEL